MASIVSLIGDFARHVDLGKKSLLGTSTGWDGRLSERF